MTDRSVGAAGESGRIADARSRAVHRLRRQRDVLRPLGFAVIVAVAAGTIDGNPAPGPHGAGLGVTLALCVFVGALALAISGSFITRSQGLQLAVIVSMGAAGIALAALQARGVTTLAGGAAVLMAVARLPLALGVTVAGGVTVGLALAAALSGSSSAAVVAAVLLCALLGFVAYFVKQARASQDRTELLLAQLEDAREDQLHAAALTERARIAGELHDVLAHSLSGAAIQLQGARKLAEREQTSAQIRTAIDRAGELVRDGLADARRAVGALRGEELPNVGQLESLIASFRNDTNVDVTLRVEGDARSLNADAGLALYRGAQEALTNVARYAPGAVTSVVLRFDDGRTILTVEDRLSEPTHRAALTGIGGGRGLAGMRDRLERTGGSMRAGPTETGWCVELEVPG